MLDNSGLVSETYRFTARQPMVACIMGSLEAWWLPMITSNMKNLIASLQHGAQWAYILVFALLDSSPYCSPKVSGLACMTNSAWLKWQGVTSVTLILGVLFLILRNCGLKLCILNCPRERPPHSEKLKLLTSSWQGTETSQWLNEFGSRFSSLSQTLRSLQF